METNGMITKMYIVLNNNKILRKYYTSKGQSGVISSLEYEGITSYDIIQLVPLDFEGNEGQDIREFDGNFKLKSLSKRISDGYVIVPEGFILQGEEIRAMTLEEKVNSGLITLKSNLKAVGNNIIKKTNTELVVEGIKTQEQIDDEIALAERNALIENEMRDLAIKSLIDKGIITE